MKTTMGITQRTKIIVTITIVLLFLIAIYTTGCIDEEESCDACDGTGKCPGCDGTGQSGRGACPTCLGTGWCELCDGDGVKETPGFELIGVGLAIALFIGVVGWKRRKSR